MTWFEAFQPASSSVVGILAAMAALSLIEMAIPLRARGRWNRVHLGPNLALTLITFATNAFMNAALVMALVWCQPEGFGLLHLLALPPLGAAILAVVALDFGSYLAHVAMHKVPSLWLFHRVHHSDPAVDVTTAIRQHPGESVVRYAFMAAFAIGLGVGPGAFGVYRAGSAISALLEHANFRVPAWLDGLLSLVTTWPNLHKVHHSRVASETDTNYGNIFSLFDRLFSTYTPSARGVNVAYGLEGFDDPGTQTTAGLLALPFRDASRSHAGSPSTAI